MMSPSPKKGRWLGGPIRWGVRGPSYVIERWVNGRHWHVSTKCRTERAALKELEKFEADPLGYLAARQQKVTGLTVTPELVDEFLEWCREQGHTQKHRDAHERYLGEVMVALEGRDLRHVGFANLRLVVDGLGTTARRNRVKAIKALCTWLRRHKGLLKRVDDPTLDYVNPAQPAEKTKRRKAMSVETVEKAMTLMREDVADVVMVLAHTGLHLSELERFYDGDGGLFEPAEWQKGAVVANLVINRHKSGQKHAVALTDPAVLAAAQRIKARPRFPAATTINYFDRKVTKALGVRFATGSLRHSLATWLAEARVPRADIAAQLGHTTTKQVDATYVDLGLAAHALPVPKLRLVR